MSLIKTVYEIAKIAFRYSGKISKFTSGESTILKKFPPGYRGYAKDVLTGTATAFHGGLIADIIKDYMLADDTPGNGVPTLQQRNGIKADPSYKTRSGRASGYNRRNRSRECFDQYGRRTSSRKRY